MRAGATTNIVRKLRSGSTRQMQAPAIRPPRPLPAAATIPASCLVKPSIWGMTEKFHAKQLYHRVDEYLEMRLGALAAASNILLKMNDYKYTMTLFEL